MLKKIKQIKFSLFQILTIFLFLIPFFWFKSGHYLLGDDDTGLTYYNPLGALNIFSSTWFSFDSLGNLNPINLYELPYAAIMYLVKISSFDLINRQAFIFGIILSGSFYFIVKTLGLIAPNKKVHAYIIAGLFYTFSSYFVLVEYYYLMPSTLVILLAPLFTYYLMLSIKTGKNQPLLIAAVWSFFLSRALATPAIINFFIFLFIFIIIFYYFNFKDKIKVAIINYFKMIVLILLINLIIVIPVIFSTLYADSNSVVDAVGDRSSQIIEMVNNLETEIGILKEKDFIIGLFPPQIMRIQGFRDFPIYANFYKYARLPMYFLIFISLMGLFFLSKYKKRVLFPIFIVFILIFFIISVDILPITREVYKYFLTHLPLFSMNRYPSMKFHITYIFFFSIFIGILLDSLFEAKKYRYLKIGFLVTFFIVILNGSYLLTGKVFTNNTNNTTSRLLDFNSDYKDLAIQLPKVIGDDSKYLLFPLGYGYGAFVPGQNSSQIYRSTTSGFKNLSGLNLLGNLKVIGSAGDPEINIQAENAFYDNDNQSLLDLTKKLNIKYIVYTKNPQEKFKNHSEIIPRYTYEKKDYYDVVEKDKPVYENNGYIVYKTKKYNETSQIEINNFDSELYFKKVSDFMYMIKVKTNSSDLIQFHERFSNQWKIYELNSSQFKCDTSNNYALKLGSVFECKHQNNNLIGNIQQLNLFSNKEVNLEHTRFAESMNAWHIDTQGQYKYYLINMNVQRYALIGVASSIVILLTYLFFIFKSVIEEKRINKKL